jgi:hypothetical protein
MVNTLTKVSNICIPSNLLLCFTWRGLHSLYCVKQWLWTAFCPPSVQHYCIQIPISDTSDRKTCLTDVWRPSASVTQTKVAHFSSALLFSRVQMLSSPRTTSRRRCLLTNLMAAQLSLRYRFALRYDCSPLFCVLKHRRPHVLCHKHRDRRISILIIGLCILLRVYQLNIGITSVRNKVFLGARFYCALLTLHVSALAAHTSKPPHHRSS